MEAKTAEDSVALSASYEISLALWQSADREELLERVLGILLRATGASGGMAWLRAEDGPQLAATAGVGPSVLVPGTLPWKLPRVIDEAMSLGQTQVRSAGEPHFDILCGRRSGQERQVLLYPVGDALLVQLISCQAGDAEGLTALLEAIPPELWSAVAAHVKRRDELSLRRREQRRLEDALARTQAHHRDLVESLPVGVYRSTLAGEFIEVNPAFLRMFGFARPEDLKAVRWSSLYADPADRRPFLDRILAIGSVLEQEVLFRRRDGQTFWGQVSATLNSDEEEERPVMGIVVDISDRKRLERELQESESRYRLLAEHALVGVYLIQDGLLCYANPALAAIFGYERHEMVDRLGPLDLTVPEDREVVSAYLQRRLAGDEDQLHYTFRGRRKDGSSITCEVLGRRTEYSGRPALLGSLLDITERRRAEARMEFISTHDVLTGLYNRAYFEQAVEQWQDDSCQYPMVAVMVDVNGLKAVNDTRGHDRGDQLLKAAAQVVRGCFRADDLVARIGGDEFTAILPRTTEAKGQLAARRIVDAAAAYSRQHQELPLSLAVGVATAEWPVRLLGEALKTADRVMYTNKAAMESGVAGRLVRTILSVLAERDLESEEHTRRLKAVAVRLGEVCGLNEAEKSALATLALVHDVGKIGVPDSVLLKPGPLSPEEKKLMAEHVDIGYRIAEASPELAFVARYIRHHHERWDGQGYPSGLKETETPLLCRILAVADAYDAMTNPRPYRTLAMSQEDAIAELRRWAGRQFDPELVEKFITQILLKLDGHGRARRGG